MTYNRKMCAIFLTVFPFSLEELAIVPSELTFPVPFSIKKFTFVNPVSVFLASLNFHISIVFALVYLFLGDSDAFSMSFVVGNLPEIDPTIIRDNMKICFLNKIFQVKIFAHRLVVQEVVSKLLLFRNFE